MKRTLGYKLIGGIVLYAVLGFLLVASLVEWTFQQKAQSTEATRLYKEALAITSNYAEDYYRNRLTQEELEAQMRVLSAYTEGEIWIVDRKGIVLIGKEEDGAPYEIPAFRISDFGTKYYCVGCFYDCFDEQMLTVFAPITVDYQVRGYVMIHKSIRQIYQAADHVLNMSYMALITLLLFSMVFLTMYLWHTYRRIWRMNRIARKYMEGDFASAMEDTFEDELGFLAASFNAILAAILYAASLLSTSW